MKKILSEERIKNLCQDFSQGFIGYCGIEAIELKPGSMASKVRITENHRQQDGFIHAGLMATMADHTAGYAAFTLVPEDCRILTIVRPAFGSELICRAKVIKPGRKVIICESEVFDSRPQGEVQTAKFLATMSSVPASDLARFICKRVNQSCSRLQAA